METLHIEGEFYPELGILGKARGPTGARARS